MVRKKHKEHIMKNLKDKVAVITGGSSGIGFGISKALAKEGVNLVISSRNPEKDSKAASQLAGLGVRTSAFECDVTDRKSIEKLADHAWSEFGHVDLIFNNAGVMNGDASTLIEAKEEDFRWLLETNLIGTWNGCSVFGRRFIEQGTPARIVNTASENSLYAALPLYGFYVATKHGILGMSDTLRLELPDFITPSVLCCGLVTTNLAHAEEERPECFGGPRVSKSLEFAEKVMQMGMSADQVGQLAVEGVKRGDFYIVTHPHNRDYIANRYEEILKAYDTYAPRFEDDEKYDVQKIFARLMS
jgi:NAD(P)-dependent dehydrogenase (short-subunit alcohol dehydrogenase family)